MVANSPEPDVVDVWRVKAEEAARRYSQDHSIENRDELRRVLRLFTDLLQGKLPPSQEPARR